MSVVDYFINSLIKRLQKIQKVRKKRKIQKRRATKTSRKLKRSASTRKLLIASKHKKVKRAKRAPRRSAKRILKKPSKAKKRKAVSRKVVKSHKARSKKAKKTVKKVIKVKETSNGIRIGMVTHFFSRIQVIVLKMNKGKLMVGDQIHILGNTTDFVQKVQSLQIESVDVRTAKKGQLVGLKVSKKAKPGDRVFKLAT